MGNKIIQRPFMALSPSKTWEGFLGALVLTVWYAYSTANVWGSTAFLRCSYPELTVAAPSGICAADRYFVVGSGSSSSGGINQISRAQMVLIRETDYCTYIYIIYLKLHRNSVVNSPEGCHPCHLVTACPPPTPPPLSLSTQLYSIVC